MGIVCVDTSNLSTSPKSLTDATGKSGESFLQLVQYLDKLLFERRPLAIVLECVAGLDDKRKVDFYESRGTDQAAHALQERGSQNRSAQCT